MRRLAAFSFSENLMQFESYHLMRSRYAEEWTMSVVKDVQLGVLLRSGDMKEILTFLLHTRTQTLFLCFMHVSSGSLKNIP